MTFNRTASKQFTKFKRAFSNYGYKGTHEAVFDRNDSFDKAILLTRFGGDIGSANENIVGKKKPFRKSGCADSRFSGTHSACAKVSSKFQRNVEFNDDFRFKIIDRHMKERKMLVSADMRRMYYDLNLEQTAERYAATCTQGHDQYDQRKEPLYNGLVGQNFGWHSSTSLSRTLELIEGFISEKKDFKYGTNSGGSMIGHYTQVVQAFTTRVGCGEAACSDGAYVVCNYYRGQGSTESPYKKGSACSSCPNGCKCWKKLCDCGTANGN
ncbi:hypothetical protein SNEBB_002100 [Seison nebaliae]|nr:hypothetical protein SNEBB_002100 [Seison nebaliae]